MSSRPTPPPWAAEVLVAEDDPVSRRLLEVTLGRWGYRVWACANGLDALERLSQVGGPRLAVLDWMMPALDGTEVCRRLRATPAGEGAYLLLLTARQELEDIVEGLAAGADDYVAKPFRPAELRARLEVGQRVLLLRERLADRVAELEAALGQVSQLQGLLPICSYCHRVRDDANYWGRVEEYIAARSQARFSHSVCPTCYVTHVQPELDALGVPSDDAKGPTEGGRPR